MQVKKKILIQGNFIKICWRDGDFLKGQSNKIFELKFFSSFKPAWATDQRVKKKIRFWLSFRRVIQIFLNARESDDFSRSYLKG